MLPVAMYHGIHDAEDDHGVFHPVYSVTVDAFRRQLDRLSAEGFTTVRLGAEQVASRPLVLSFDDGDVTTVEVALPLLLERGMVAEFFVISDAVGRPGMLTHDDVRALADAGMGVQSHGRTHEPLADLPPAALEEELETSRAHLQAWSGRPVEAVSWPGGRGGARERRAARRLGYRWVLDSRPDPNRHQRPGRPLHRVAITRSASEDDVADLVAWRGVAPRRALARTLALELPKRVLGNERYGAVRARLLASS